MNDLYKPKLVPEDLSDFKKLDKIWKENWAQLWEQDKTAKKKGVLIGRFLSESIGDGRAVYQIIGETETKAKIRVCTGLGDDWVIPYWGEEASIDKKYALKFLRAKDSLNEEWEKRTETKKRDQ